jgi:hypothetical protein
MMMMMTMIICCYEPLVMILLWKCTATIVLWLAGVLLIRFAATDVISPYGEAPAVVVGGWTIIATDGRFGRRNP